MSKELAYQLALELIPGAGNRGVKQLISYCGSAYAVFQTPKARLMKIPGVGEKLAASLKSEIPLKEAESIIQLCERMNVKILHYTNPNYPSRLKLVPDAPNILYQNGSGDLNPQRCVAIVGTRKATEYGKQLTDQIVADLNQLGATVVSGLAYGIDIQAHKSAIKYGLPTFSVLAGGLDRVYPSAHQKYLREMMDSGGAVSESIPGTKPDPHLFPARNRIIAGLCDATIVVEAAAKGGALITAHIADSYNRLVFAVPGNIGQTYSEGSNRLIASQKALIYTGIEDLIFHLNWDIDQEDKRVDKVLELTEPEQLIFDLLGQSNEPLEIDLIAIKSNLRVNEVASLLLNLEFKNLIRSMPGKKYATV